MTPGVDNSVFVFPFLFSLISLSSAPPPLLSQLYEKEMDMHGSGL